MTRCLSGDHANPGDTVRLGVCLGNPLEAGERWGRLVAIRHKEVGMQHFVVRKYREGDGAFPTGEYVATWLLVPHRIKDRGLR